MSITYDFFELPPLEGDEEGKKRYCARPVNTVLYTSEDIIKTIAGACSLTEGDVKAALSALSDVLAGGLNLGFRVYLEGIGYFSPKLKCSLGEETDEPDPYSVKLKGIKFLPDNELKKKISYPKFVRASKLQSTDHTPEEIDAKLEEYFQTNEYITRKGFRSLFGFTASTAIRRIETLLEEGKLLKESLHFSLYRPAPGWYGK